jgi:hypothetical protein
MEKTTFGLSVKWTGGHFDVRCPSTIRRVKSAAGRLFRDATVQSVCVYDSTGIARLYLKKTEKGVLREERSPNSLLTKK